MLGKVKFVNRVRLSVGLGSDISEAKGTARNKQTNVRIIHGVVSLLGCCFLFSSFLQGHGDTGVSIDP